MEHQFEPSLMGYLFVLAVEQAGIDPLPLVESSGLTREELSDPMGILSSKNLFKLMEQAKLLAEDPHVSIRAVRFISNEMFGLSAYSIITQPTLREALLQGIKNFGYFNSVFTMAFAERKRETALEMKVTDPDISNRLMGTEFFSILNLQVLRNATGENLIPDFVCFTHEPIADAAPMERFFGCPVKFGQQRNEIVYPTSWMEIRCVGANKEVSAFLANLIDQETENFPKKQLSYAENGRLAIRELLGKESISLKKVSHHLGVSPRTFQHQLKKEGFSFSQLCEEERKAYAGRKIMKGEHANEVAYQLGYRHPPTFTRAFYRWFGMPPGVYFKQSNEQEK